MNRHIERLLVVVVVIVLGTIGIGCAQDVSIVSTVAEIQVVHDGVTADGRPVKRAYRIVDGGIVETDADGRGRTRLDDGTVVVVDGSTKFSVSPGRLSLERGRLFVVGGIGVRTLIEFGDGNVVMVGGQVGIERRDKSTVYVADGEIVVHAGGKDHSVRSGESASVKGNAVEVAPTLVFDDWTGGLASSWGTSGQMLRVVGVL
ncbi:MAG: hypothetical protein FWD57_17160, partial [Polyangiaceae bacterium]|nr:hypothetical protein [Polyangiaceae bacterium]